MDLLLVLGRWQGRAQIEILDAGDDFLSGQESVAFTPRCFQDRRCRGPKAAAIDGACHARWLLNRMRARDRLLRVRPLIDGAKGNWLWLQPVLHSPPNLSLYEVRARLTESNPAIALAGLACSLAKENARVQIGVAFASLKEIVVRNNIREIDPLPRLCSHIAHTVWDVWGPSGRKGWVDFT